MHAPRQGTSETAKNVVPLHPAPVRHGPGLLLQDSALGAGVDADAEGGGREEAEEARRHFGHDGAEDLGRGELSLPCHVVEFRLGHLEDEGGGGGGGGRGPNILAGNKGTRSGERIGGQKDAQAYQEGQRIRVHAGPEEVREGGGGTRDS